MRRTTARGTTACSQVRTEAPTLQTLLAVVALVVAWIVMAVFVGLLGGCGLAANGPVVEQPDSVRTFQHGVLAVDDHQFGEAVQAFRRVAADGYCDPGWNNAGVAHSRLGDNSAALAAYGRAMVECPSAVVRYNRGSLYLRLRWLEEAVRDLRTAVVLEPDMAEAWNNLGLALLLTGRQGEALFAMQRAVRLRPSLARPWNNIGVVLSRMGRTAQARAAYQRALRLDNSHQKARRNLDRLSSQLRGASPNKRPREEVSLTR